jgi:hypothetical protein
MTGDQQCFISTIDERVTAQHIGRTRHDNKNRQQFEICTDGIVATPNALDIECVDAGHAETVCKL